MEYYFSFQLVFFCEIVSVGTQHFDIVFVLTRSNHLNSVIYVFYFVFIEKTIEIYILFLFILTYIHTYFSPILAVARLCVSVVQFLLYQKYFLLVHCFTVCLSVPFLW